MAIEKKLLHFKKYSDFNSKKLSANVANTQYTLGVDGAVTSGEPDVKYQSICWIKDVQKIWTHGVMYNCADLISGTNIKTINGESILGSGDINLPKHVECTWEYYDALTTKDEDTLYFILDRNTIYKGWTKYSEATGDVPYLTIEVLEDDCTIGFSFYTIQYSTDLNTWSNLPVGSTISANAGDKVYFKASGLTSSMRPANTRAIGPKEIYGIGTFTVSKKFNLSGNCMSMLFGDDAATNFDLTGYDYAFYQLFYSCKTLQSVSKTFLPATTLDYACYKEMFYGCSALTTAPELPATTLANCNWCYYAMFSYCTSLTSVPALLPATTLATGCYDNMFRNCTSLTTAPELPATTLTAATDRCYYLMFYGCTNLNYIKMLATDISSGSGSSIWGCLTSWVSGVSSTGTFVKNAAMTSLPTGVNGIPSGWTVEYILDISGGTTNQILAKKSDTTHDTEWKSVKTINGTSILGSGDITIESGENNVQSNWTETDTSSDAYILNKPTLGTAAAKDVASDGNASTSQVVMGNDTRLSDARPASDVYPWAKASSKPTYTASEVGAISSTLKGANNGVAELDSNGKVPSTQLPSYVDDVLEYSSLNDFPTTGETGKIYIAIDTNKTYRWSGSTYVEISSSLALGETSSTAYRGDRGKVAYDHSQTTGNPHNTAFADIAKKPTTIAGYGITDAFSGNYNDLTNKPNLAAVTTSGNYNDLTNKPTIPTVNNATLTIQKNGSNVASFTANSSKNVTANITVPTSDSDLTNDRYVRYDGTQSLTDAQKSNARTNIGAAASSHSHSTYVNQNAFSNVKVGETTIAADSTTDTLTLVAGSNVTITPDATNDKITISSSYTNTDTKNTAGSTDTSSKIFLVGAISQAANPQTYSHDTAFVGTDGCLYSGGNKVKTVQTAVSDPTASGTSTTYIDSIAQNTNGVITATKKSLPTASTTVAGITKVGTTGGAAAYSHSHSYNDLTNKPNLAAVATSGDYNDLTNRPNANVSAVYDEDPTIIDVNINKYIIKTTDDDITLTNNTYYRKTNISSNINISFELPEDDTIFTSYSIELTTSDSGTTITFPATVKWLNGNIPTLENNTTYQISVMNNLGVCAKYE